MLRVLLSSLIFKNVFLIENFFWVKTRKNTSDSGWSSSIIDSSFNTIAAATDEGQKAVKKWYAGSGNYKFPGGGAPFDACDAEVNIEEYASFTQVSQNLFN